MKNFFKVFVVGFVAMFMMLSCTRIEPGYIGLKIDMAGNEKGAVTEVKPGVYFNVNPYIDYLEFPNFLQTYKWTEEKTKESPTDEAIRFQTSEGLQITVDMGVAFTIDSEPGSAAKLYLTYRKGLDEIIHGNLLNRVKDSFTRYGSSYTADQIISEKKNELLGLVQADIQSQFKGQLSSLTLSYLSSPRPPQSVIDALNAKVQATQIAMQRENEVRTAEAQAAIKMADARGVAESSKIAAEAKAKTILLEAEAQAKANRMLSDSMTDRLIQYEYAKKWDGQLPTVQGGNAGMILDLKPGR